MNGFIYIMSNPAFADRRIKIGISKSDPTGRKDDLYSTGVPEPFKVEYYALVENYEKLEKSVHLVLEKKRPNKNREFFNVSVEDAIVAIRTIAESTSSKINYEKVIYEQQESILVAQKKLDDKAKFIEQEESAIEMRAQEEIEAQKFQEKIDKSIQIRKAENRLWKDKDEIPISFAIAIFILGIGLFILGLYFKTML